MNNKQNSETDSVIKLSDNLERGNDACKGDSGGPAVKDNTLFGIVSFGGCDELNLPTAFTNVYIVSQWIRDKMESL